LSAALVAASAETRARSRFVISTAIDFRIRLAGDPRQPIKGMLIERDTS